MLHKDRCYNFRVIATFHLMKKGAFLVITSVFKTIRKEILSQECYPTCYLKGDYQVFICPNYANVLC